MRKKNTQSSFCPLAHPTNSSSHFCPKNSICHWQKTLTHQVFVMKINHHDSQPSGLRLQLTFPRKTASVPAVQFTDGDHVIMFSAKNLTLSLSRMFWSYLISFKIQEIKRGLSSFQPYTQYMVQWNNFSQESNSANKQQKQGATILFKIIHLAALKCKNTL